MKRCVIVGAGEVTDIGALKQQVYGEDYIIAVDNGLKYIHELQLNPDLILGDFDSYKGVVPTGENVLRYKSEKDDTDTMLALKIAIEKGFKQVLFAGMLGGRLDHTFANIQAVAYAANRGVSLIIWDKDNTVRAIKESTITISPIEGHMVGVFSFTDVCTGVGIKHAKYLLSDATLTNDYPIGVSNEFVKGKDMEISVKKGTLIVITTKNC